MQQKQQYENAKKKEDEKLGVPYHNVQSLKTGKAFEEGGHHLDVAVDSEAHLQAKCLDACDHHAWTCLNPSLKWTQFSHKVGTLQ
jgi:hypothetical protein